MKVSKITNTRVLFLVLATIFASQANAAVYDHSLYTIHSPYGVAKLTCSKPYSGMIYVGNQDDVIFRLTNGHEVNQVQVASIRDLSFEKSGSQAVLKIDIGEAQALKFVIKGTAGENANAISYHTELDWSSDSPVTDAGRLIESGLNECHFEVLK